MKLNGILRHARVCCIQWSDVLIIDWTKKRKCAGYVAPSRLERTSNIGTIFVVYLLLKKIHLKLTQRPGILHRVCNTGKVFDAKEIQESEMARTKWQVVNICVLKKSMRAEKSSDKERLGTSVPVICYAHNKVELYISEDFQYEVTSSLWGQPKVY